MDFRSEGSQNGTSTSRVGGATPPGPWETKESPPLPWAPKHPRLAAYTPPPARGRTPRPHEESYRTSPRGRPDLPPAPCDVKDYASPFGPQSDDLRRR